jgi:hypothetical protein
MIGMWGEGLEKEEKKKGKKTLKKTAEAHYSVLHHGSSHKCQELVEELSGEARRKPGCRVDRVLLYCFYKTVTVKVIRQVRVAQLFSELVL